MAKRAQEPIGRPYSASNSPGPRNRLLALEIRSSKMGFVVYEGPTKLLDWGVRQFGVKEDSLRSTVSSRIEALLRIHNPLTVVARDRTYYSAAANRRFAIIVSLIRAGTKRHSATFKILSTRQVQRHFALRGYVTKHGIATDLSGRFEELSWRLPTRRKPYEGEAPAMVIFDAAANGLAFYGRPARQEGRIDPMV
jgi:hypothetical protein